MEKNNIKAASQKNKSNQFAILADLRKKNRVQYVVCLFNSLSYCTSDVE